MDTSQDIVIADSNTTDNVEVRSISPRVAAIFDDIYYFFYKEIDIEFTRYTDNKLISERMYGKRIDFFISILYITRNIIESYNNVELLKCFFKMLNHCSKPNENIENFLMKLFTYLHSDSILDNIEIIRALRDNKLKIRRETQDYLNQILDKFYKKPKEAEERDGDDGLPMEFVRQDTLSKLFREIYNDIRDLLPEPIQVRHLLSRNIDGTFKLKEVLFYEFDRVSEDHWFYDDGKQSNIYSPEEINNNTNNKNSVLLDANDKNENNNNNNDDADDAAADDADDADDDDMDDESDSNNNNKNSNNKNSNNKNSNENNKNKRTKSSSKSPQLPGLWTDEECRSLIKAVMIIGHRWIKIKEDYYSTSKRKPSQLKDKMRSLRKRYGDIKNIAIAYFTKAEIIEIEKLAVLFQQKEEAQKLAKEKIDSLSNIKSTSNTSAASGHNKGKNENNDSDEEVDQDSDNDSNNEDNQNESESENEDENDNNEKEKEKRNKKNSAVPPAPAPPKKLKPIEEEESDEEHNDSEEDSQEDSEENEYIIKQKRKSNQIKSSPKKLKTNQSVDKSEDVNQSHKSKLKSKPQRKVEKEESEKEESEEEESEEEEEEDDEDYESEEDKKKKKSKKTPSNQTSTHTTTTTTTTRKSNTKPIVVSSEEDSSDEEEKRRTKTLSKKSNQTPTTPTKKPSQTPTTPTKKSNQTPTTPTKKPSQTPITPTKKPNQTPTTPTKKSSQTPITPTKKSTNRPKSIEEEENEQEEQHEKNQNKPLKKRVSEDWSNSSDKTSNKRFKSPETLNKDSKENKKTISNSRRK
ncbi:myb domain-containing protein [Dictyostelium discoideum AX4]|uniref:Myb-like protein V n=1 Tax=Dictyostelium discoideum TaxID=44689 RepID=MYBV_DICDI|nr:myb domain-containing protein [Dictyostelium discoideum AX4]Q54X08.2 RecName: Full=Myb-like protein V [Dictyostelium discoideum]EAL67789.2 myb domain-containing protein [Dictyostelium discoideum AX4]|eukprot:XP_641769.2 myb domain-containing protein [Dictyostelium discoideum AX4]